MSKTTAKNWISYSSGSGIALYPIIAHIAIYLNEIKYLVLYMFGICFIYSWRFPGPFAWLVRGVIIVFVLFIASGFLAPAYVNYILLIPPTLIPAWLAFVFIESLFSRRGAIVTRIAAMFENNSLDDLHVKYTRTVTLIWGIVLLCIALESLILQGVASYVVWSWWAHIGNPIIIASLFVIELLARWIVLNKKPNFAQLAYLVRKRPWVARD